MADIGAEVDRMARVDGIRCVVADSTGDTIYMLHQRWMDE